MDNEGRYDIYGWFIRCRRCDPEQSPLAVGIKFTTVPLRMMKYRSLRRRVTPAEIRNNPDDYVIRMISRRLEWEEAYRLIHEFGVPRISASRF